MTLPTEEHRRLDELAEQRAELEALHRAPVRELELECAAEAERLEAAEPLRPSAGVPIPPDLRELGLRRSAELAAELRARHEGTSRAHQNVPAEPPATPCAPSSCSP